MALGFLWRPSAPVASLSSMKLHPDLNLDLDMAQKYLSKMVCDRMLFNDIPNPNIDIDIVSYRYTYRFRYRFN